MKWQPFLFVHVKCGVELSIDAILNDGVGVGGLMWDIFIYYYMITFCFFQRIFFLWIFFTVLVISEDVSYGTHIRKECRASVNLFLKMSFIKD